MKLKFTGTTGLWTLTALTPGLTILYSYLLGVWDWGLMDDLTILGMGSGVIERIVGYLNTSIAFGHFQVFFSVHSGIFYTLFENNPVDFYVFKALEIAVILGIWGLASYRITKSALAVVLLPTITLSFHYFYDAFFYLSSHEFIGLFFLGLALHCFLSGFQSWPLFALGVFFLVCTFCSKETFVSTGFAAGGAYLLLAWKHKKSPQFNRILSQALVLLFCSAAFTVFLLKFIQSSYTASYNPANFSKIMTNVSSWFKKDFLNHLPWLMAACWIRYPFRISNTDSTYSWGMGCAVLLYLGFAAILLPWNTLSYYATPLGVFFAFIITNWISKQLEGAKASVNMVLVLFALAFNQLVCQYALHRESTYQADTRLLLEWIHINQDSFQNESQLDVLSNAMEPSVAIPMLLKHKWGMTLNRFRWSNNPNRDALQEKQGYYLYGSRFHSIDPLFLKGWKPIFFTKNWIFYHRTP